MSKNKSNNNGAKGGFKDQLKSAFPMAGKRVNMPSMPSMWQGDGVDHINVHWSGETVLGKRHLPLASKLFKPVNNPILGEFATLQNLWGFVRAANPDDRMRHLPTKALFNLIADTGGNFPNMVNAKALLFEAAYLSYLQNTQVAELLMKNDLPFDIYNTQNAVIPTRDKNAVWHAMALTEISNALREGRDPSFFLLLDRDYIDTRGLRESDYRVEHAYTGVVERWVGGVWPKSVDFKEIYAKARQQLADDIAKRQAAIAKRESAVVAVTEAGVENQPAVEMPVVEDVDSVMVEEHTTPVEAAAVPVEEPAVDVCEVAAPEEVDLDEETSEAEVMAMVAEADAVVNVVNTTVDNDMPEDLRLEIAAVQGNTGVIEAV